MALLLRSGRVVMTISTTEGYTISHDSGQPERYLQLGGVIAGARNWWWPSLDTREGEGDLGLLEGDVASGTFECNGALDGAWELRRDTERPHICAVWSHRLLFTLQCRHAVPFSDR